MQLVPLLDHLVGWLVDRDAELAGFELWPDGHGQLVALPRRPCPRPIVRFPRCITLPIAAEALAEPAGEGAG